MMVSVDYYVELKTALRPVLKDRTEAVLREGLARTGKSPDDLRQSDVERILKRVVYPELQKHLPADEARRKVMKLLTRLTGGVTRGGILQLEDLEEALRTFGIYIDWEEVQKLRRLVNGLRAEWNEEQAREAAAVVKSLREKLESRLVVQGRRLADLRETYERVKKIGGRKVRRLGSLISQISEAHEQGILASGELEQAQSLASELKKLVESSVVAPVSDELVEAEGDSDVVVVIESDEPLELDLNMLTPEQVGRIQEIERAEEERRLKALAERYAVVLGRGDWGKRLEELKGILEEGELLGDRLAQFEKELEHAYAELLAEARARYEWVAEKLRQVEQKGVSAASLWAQLEAVSESLRRGVYPEGLGEIEREAERLLAEATAREEAARRAQKLAREALAFAAEARGKVDPAQHPELARDLERLAVQAESGEVDEELYSRVREAVPKAIADHAEALKARLLAVPDSEQFAKERREAEEALAKGDLGRAEKAVAKLEAAVRAHRAAQLEELKLRAQRFKVEVPEILAAEGALEAGHLPGIEKIRSRLEERIASQRRRAQTLLARLKPMAERYLGLGGEALLERIAEAEAALSERLPDLEALEDELKSLEGRREALRRSLADRFQKLVQEFSRYKGMTGETRSRLGALMGFLEPSFSRLERLGTEGLLELEKALSEAEPLLEQLAQEYQAARELASDLGRDDLEDLLGVFALEKKEPAPEDPDQRYRLRGVELVVRLPSRDIPIPDDLLAALKFDLEAAGDPRLATLYLPDHVLIYAFLPEGELVILAEKPLLNRLLRLIEEERARAEA